LYIGGPLQPPVSPSATMNIPKPKLPPGPSYVVSQFFSGKTASYVLFVALVHLAVDAAGIYVPVWATVAVSVAALPAILYAQSELSYWRDKRTAVALGARLAPKVAGKRPLGMDLVAVLLEAQETGYISKF